MGRSKSKKSKSKSEEKVKKKKSKSSSKSKPRKSSKNTVADLKPIKEKFSQSGLAEHLSTQTDVEKKHVKKVLNALNETILASIKRGSRGEFVLPGLLKVVAKKVPAKPARKGRNPFTGEPMTFKAKPKTIKCKLRPMKKLKEAVLSD